MAATSAGTQQQQHKMNVNVSQGAAVANTAAVISRNHVHQQQQANSQQQPLQQHSIQQQNAMLFMQQQQNPQRSNLPQQHQQHLQYMQEQQQPQFQFLKQQQKQQHQQRDHHLINGQPLAQPNQQRQQQYTQPLQQQHPLRQKFVTRAVTNSNGTLQHQQRQQQSQPQQQHQILPAGMVNRSNSAPSGTSLRQAQQQQQESIMYQTNSSQQHQQQLLQGKLQQQHQTAIATPPPTIASRYHAPMPNKAPSTAYASNSVTPTSSTTTSTSAAVTSATTTTVAIANLAPGWRRLNANNEVIYISPTGATLRTQFQIKDYLLSPGTCKCGLPCPLRPEFFFDFNAQVPNSPLKTPTQEAHQMAQNSTSLSCLHQKRFVESQSLHSNLSSSTPSLSYPSSTESEMSVGNYTTKDTKHRKVTASSTLLSATESSVGNMQLQRTSLMNQIPQSNKMLATAIEHEQQLSATKQLSNGCSIPIESSVASEGTKSDRNLAGQIGSVSLTKTPPWRKNTSASAEERVPPLPEGHLSQEQTTISNESSANGIPPPWQSSASRQNSPSRLRNGNAIASPVKRSLSAPAKKQPNFKDDPTGYLQQQTELLHSSMMNVARGADEEETGTIEDLRQHQQQLVTQVQKSRIETATMVKHPQPQVENVVENKNTPQQNCFQYAGRIFDSQSETQAYQQPQETGAMFRVQQQRKAIQVINHQVITPSSHTVTNASASPTIPSKHNENSKTLNTQDSLQPFTTTFGGQTVTQMPNGLVHIEQSCSGTNVAAPLKPQQQVQLQQQIQQHNILYRQNIQQQKQTVGNDVLRLVPTAQESPVSSSTTYTLSTPEKQRQTSEGNNKGPAQVGAISTSNDSPRFCPPSPAESVESAGSRPSSVKTAPSPAMQNQTSCSQQLLQARHQYPSQPQKPVQQVKIVRQQQLQQHQRVSPQQPVAKSPVTAVAGSRTATTTSASPASAATTPTTQQKYISSMQKTSPNSNNASVSNLQLQPIVRSANTANTGQIIMTSTGQIIVMPTNGKPQSQQGPQQLIIATGGSQSTATPQQQGSNVILHQQQNQVDVINGQHLTTAPSSSIILQNSQQQQGTSGFIVSQGNSATPQLQPTTVILNTGQNILASNGAKVLTTNGNNIIHTGNQQLIPGNHQLLTAQNSLGQQAVVLNSLSNGGYVIQQQHQPANQQQFATMDGQVVSQIVQQADGTTTYVQQSPSGQQQTQRIIITSPDNAKRKAKKRKSSDSISPTSTPSALSPQISPTIPNQTATVIHAQQSATQQPQMVQIASATGAGPPYQQQFQLSPGIQGIVVNKATAAQNSISAQPQQILLQNGQLIQPMNLIGQQLLVPAGLVMAPEATLLQIQNMGTCGASILTTTPSGTMMLRAPSPQNKQFLSPTATGQQFIVGSNGQLSPIGQIYSTPMGLVVPQQNAGAAFVQQNATIQVQQQQQQQQQHQMQQQQVSLQHSQQLQQQQQSMNLSNNNLIRESATSSSSSALDQRASAASPPDTTTHSPRSPERPASNRSGGSEMVQCVSSSEPDGAVSPQSVESRQSPSTMDCERGIVMSTSYQTSNIYKPSETKIRRVHTPPQYGATAAGIAGAAQTLLSSSMTATTLTTSLNPPHHHNQQQQQQHQRASDVRKTDSHESPANSPTTTSTTITPPPPPSPATPIQIQPQQQQSSPQCQNTPTKQSRQRAARGGTCSKSYGHNNITTTTTAYLNQHLGCIASSQQLAQQQQQQQLRSFSVGELIWGTARGYPAWPGKIIRMPESACSTTHQQSENVWVQWFGGGGRSNSELVAMSSLQSLSEGLDAHHKAQKDTRKSRKLNSQLERAIQEAMIELDRISASSRAMTSTSPGNGSLHQLQQQQPTSTSNNNTGSPNRSKRGQAVRTLVSYGAAPATITMSSKNSNSTAAPATTTMINNIFSQTTSQQRTKPIRIAPAPPGIGNSNTLPTKAALNLMGSPQQQAPQTHSMQQGTLTK